MNERSGVFLKSNVTEHPDHFEMETKSGREVWLIDPNFLEQHYPFADGTLDDMLTSRDNDSDNGTGAKNLQKQWQKNKQNQLDNEQAPNESATNVDTDKHDKSRDGVSDTVGESQLWELVKDLQSQVKKKDEQLDPLLHQTTGHDGKDGNACRAGEYSACPITKRFDSSDGEGDCETKRTRGCGCSGG